MTADTSLAFSITVAVVIVALFWYVLHVRRGPDDLDADRIVDGVLDEAFKVTPFAPDELFDLATKAMKDRAARAEFEKRAAMSSPRIVALHLVAGAAARCLRSGRYHVYRGMLGIDGLAALEIYDWAGMQLRASGAITQEEIARRHLGIRDEIKAEG